VNAGERFRAGDDIAVDLAEIEQSLSDLWRTQGEQSDEAVTKAALWNVLAHTCNAADQALATEALGIASASVPQRSIVIRADVGGEPELSSWVSANCYLTGDARQVCSEEIAIVAGGERVRHIPSLVNALLVPDMPVAAWWLGDLPDSDQSYAAVLLEPAERFIVDSSAFDSPADLELLSMIGHATATTPADLNWMILESWRIATATMFDAAPIRARIGDISSARIFCGVASPQLGQRIAPVLYGAWLSAAAGREIPLEFDFIAAGSGQEGIEAVRIDFSGGGRMLLRTPPGTSSVIGEPEDLPGGIRSVTPSSGADTSTLIVRQLAEAEPDPWYPALLPQAVRLLRSL
jgi:glucose-6-phosphate dehydrogenase assembly protein OpcA